jgi:hypothetical protein
MRKSCLVYLYSVRYICVDYVIDNRAGRNSSLVLCLYIYDIYGRNAEKMKWKFVCIINLISWILWLPTNKVPAVRTKKRSDQTEWLALLKRNSIKFFAGNEEHIKNLTGKKEEIKVQNKKNIKETYCQYCRIRSILTGLGSDLWKKPDLDLDPN